MRVNGQPWGKIENITEDVCIILPKQQIMILQGHLILCNNVDGIQIVHVGGIEEAEKYFPRIFDE